jgi:hypothetical protein
MTLLVPMRRQQLYLGLQLLSEQQWSLVLQWSSGLQWSWGLRL